MPISLFVEKRDPVVACDRIAKHPHKGRQSVPDGDWLSLNLQIKDEKKDFLFAGCASTRNQLQNSPRTNSAIVILSGGLQESLLRRRVDEVSTRGHSGGTVHTRETWTKTIPYLPVKPAR